MSAEILAFFAVLILSLSFHEAAHAWSADRLGDPTARRLGRLTMNPLSHIDPIGTILFPLLLWWSGLPMLGWAKPVPVDMRNLRAPRRDFAMVAAAGPFSNLILAFSAAVVLRVLLGSHGMPGILTIDGLLTQIVLLNVLLAVFNLVPVPPLDGGNVLAGFVPENVARFIDMLRPWGFFIIYGLMLTGVLWQIIGPVESLVLGWLLL